MNNLLDTKTLSFNEFIGNGKIYKVPLFQRDYSWEEENWEDLWNDMNFAWKNKSTHYMGAIVLQDNGDKEFLIIDGQQRLATLSIFVLAVIKNLQNLVDQKIDSKTNKERIEVIYRDFLGNKDAVSLKESSKLFLNENNDKFYQHYLLQSREPNVYRKLSDSQKLLWDCFKYFEKKLEKNFKNKNGKEVTNFLTKYVSENLMFIQIVVKNEIDAYTVFETLNSRGVELTTTDLLKNFLFSFVASSDVDLDRVKEQWKSIIDIVKLKEFPDFLRYFLNSKYQLVSKRELFKKTKRLIKNREEMFNLLDDLEKSAELYVAFGNPNDDFWNDKKIERKYISELKLFNVKLSKSVLLSAYEKFNQQEFRKLLRVCSIVSFRYNKIGGLNPKVMEVEYNKAAIKIFNNKIRTAKNIFKNIKNALYVPDENFKNTFSTKTVSTSANKKLVRYILLGIENKLSGTDLNYEENSSTIEHILPENPSLEWEEYFNQEDQEKYIYRLGNYALLKDFDNKKADNDLFKHKKKIYLNSEYKISNEIKNEEWTPDVLQNRQKKLAKIACSVWRLDF
ncbi:DUF262 domain-containing protein [Candidatus Parcubacteria bacterium]|nr:DUF262 domain-containing protein [Candidatus Parcubacteria bacterium]